MTPLLALQAAAVYASALLLVRLLSPAERRAALVTATALVLALPLAAFAPRWSAPPLPLPEPLRLQVGSLQEPGSAGHGAAALTAAGPTDLVHLLGLAWGLGAAFAALRVAVDIGATLRLRGTARERVGDVATSPAVHGPLVVGAIFPLVLLPPDAAGWSPARRAQVLTHERAHVAGRDNLWILLARGAACVHWFNPLAWWAVEALRDACERRADEAALAAGADPADYARTLLDVARGGPAAALAMARPTGLEARVRAVLGVRPKARPVGAALGLAALGVVALGTATAAPGVGASAGSSGSDRAGASGLGSAVGLGTGSSAGSDGAGESGLGSAGAQGAASGGALVGTASSLGVGAARGSDAALVRRLSAEADTLVATYTPEAVGLLVLDVRSGAVLGEVDRGGLLDRPVSPGSVLKPFTVAAALEAGVPLDTEVPEGTLGSVLACSSNPGAVAVGRLAGRDAVARMYGRVGLHVPAGLDLEPLVLGDGVLVSPRQVAAAWLHLAGRGALAAPLAAEVRGLLRGVTEAEDGTGLAAALPDRHVAGKTGTAPLVGADGRPIADRVLASFVGLVPAEEPTTLVLVTVAGPHTEEPWGGRVAAPAFRDIVLGMGR